MVDICKNVRGERLNLSLSLSVFLLYYYYYYFFLGWATNRIQSLLGLHTTGIFLFKKLMTQQAEPKA